MGLFSDLTNIYDNDLKNIHGNEVYNFINRNKDKIEELDKNIIFKIKEIKMGLFSDLTNIYDNDLKNIHGNEVYNFINRNKDKIEELDKNIIRDFIVKINYINSLKTKNYQKSYQISKIKKEIIQKDQRIAELEEENKKLKERQCCGMEFCDLDLQNNIEIGLLQNKVKKLEKEAEDKNIWRKEDGRRTSR